MGHENLLRKLIGQTVPESDRADYFAELDGDVERDEDDGQLYTSGGNRVVYGADGSRTEYDDNGQVVATSVDSELSPDLPANPSTPGPVEAKTGTPARKSTSRKSTSRKSTSRKSTGGRRRS